MGHFYYSVIFQYNILLVNWEFRILHLDHIHFLVFPSPPPLFLISPKGEEEEKIKR